VQARLGNPSSPLAAPSAPAGRAAVGALPLSAALLRSLEQQLAHHIGPLAQHLVRRAAARAPDWDQLIDSLAAEIDAPAARAQFVSACRTLARPTP
jgi:hypothetical protein